nr:immunoglobulin heavy chain junction region [Macaca mulatta]
CARTYWGDYYLLNRFAVW